MSRPVSSATPCEWHGRYGPHALRLLLLLPEVELEAAGDGLDLNCDRYLLGARQLWSWRLEVGERRDKAGLELAKDVDQVVKELRLKDDSAARGSVWSEPGGVGAADQSAVHGVECRDEKIT